MQDFGFPLLLGEIYVNFVKIGALVVLLLGWAAITSWVDKDTDVVKTKREQWNIIVMIGGFAGLAMFLLPPWKGPLYFVGLGMFLLLAGGAQLLYVLHRNGRVVPTAKVLTRDHFRRILEGKEKKSAGAESKGTLVRLMNYEGKPVRPSDDDPELVVDYDLTQGFMHDILWRRASDVDLVRNNERYRMVYRVDGLPTERPEGLPLEDGDRVVRFLKGIAGLNIEERRKPQSGKIKAALLTKDGSPDEMEIQTSGSTAGERLRLRQVGSAEVRRLAEIGMAPARQEKLKALIEQRHGLILVSGPRGSGVTTTFYAVLRAHDAFLNNIHTIERQPMTALDNITQNKHDRSTSDVSYARLLQTVLRREPDIVGIGECEDRETAQLAARATDERKIYLVIEGVDAFDALTRYLKFAEDPRLAARGLLGVTSQRLLRKLCTSCREAFRPDPAKLKKLNLPADKIERFFRPPTEPILDKKGNEIICESCQGTGYLGRTSILELLVVDDAIRELIVEGASVDRIKTQARRNKMYLLQEEGLFKVIEGVTSLNEVQRVLSADGK
ncbi:MAG: hypothetical protein FLDDKLPJ_00967 [Phycisphaerae bacterium]|nr:hypothetical protein [Phycisphaerae bacterium]